MHSALQRLPIFLVFLVFPTFPKTTWFGFWPPSHAVLPTDHCILILLSFFLFPDYIKDAPHGATAPAVPSAWNTLHQIFRYFSHSLHVGLIWIVLHLKVISLETPSLTTLSKRSPLPFKILQSLFKPLSRMWATWDQGKSWFLSL